MEIDDERERQRERKEEIVLSRRVSPAMGRKAVIYAKCKAAAVIANCAQVFHLGQVTT